MKDRVDFSLVGALLRKQAIERRYGFRKGNFDIIGFLLRAVLVALFVTIFVIFFGRFAAIYTAVPTKNHVDVPQRVYEILAFAYLIILILMTLSSVSAIVRELFLADDIKIFSAMPVSAKSLFVAKLIGIYRGQLVFAFITVLTVNIALAPALPEGVAVWFYCMTPVMCAGMPLITIAVGSILALPFYVVRQFLQPRFFLLFFVVTLIAAGAIALYSIVLGAVKELLLGGRDIGEFFNEGVMENIRVIVSYCYPSNWFAAFVLKHELVVSGLCIPAVLVCCVAISMLIIRSVLTRALQARISGDENFIYTDQPLTEKGHIFTALLKKEFVQIFRTPSYMFSYFSVAILMPLMVYFCMDVGASMIEEQFGLDCSLELALFLTLLFSALTNVFCSTNISREGPMFYSMKALPVSHREVVFTKVFFCMMVTLVSQLISALMLGITEQVTWPMASFVFAIGVVFSFGQICFATRYDFNHARFSSEDDGEIRETGGTVSAIIVVGMLVAFLVGFGMILVRVFFAMRTDLVGTFDWLSYALASAITFFIALISFTYLIGNLGKRYYEFSGGGLF